MTIPIYQVDAFTAEPFQGNPAGVCLIAAARPDAWMQNVAKEMNLSETAFPLPEGEGFRLRWFTPTTEVDLCGHATLATAHVLWEAGCLAPEETARFQSRSGLLSARRAPDGWIEMDFPAKRIESAPAPHGLLAALGVKPLFVGKNVFDYLVEVEDEATVRQATPDMARLMEIEARGVILTSRAGAPGCDFVSRFFAPRVGVPEDPVTGSAHTALAPYWAGKLHTDTLNAYQASARGGRLRLRVEGERVIIGGQAVTVLRGELAG